MRKLQTISRSELQYTQKDHASVFVSPKILAREGGVVDTVKNFLTYSWIITQNLVVVSHAVRAYRKSQNVGDAWDLMAWLTPWKHVTSQPELPYQISSLWVEPFGRMN